MVNVKKCTAVLLIAALIATLLFCPACRQSAGFSAESISDINALAFSLPKFSFSAKLTGSASDDIMSFSKPIIVVSGTKVDSECLLGFTYSQNGQTSDLSNTIYVSPKAVYFKVNPLVNFLNKVLGADITTTAKPDQWLPVSLPDAATFAALAKQILAAVEQTITPYAGLSATAYEFSAAGAENTTNFLLQLNNALPMQNITTTASRIINSTPYTTVKDGIVSSPARDYSEELAAFDKEIYGIAGSISTALTKAAADTRSAATKVEQETGTSSVGINGGGGVSVNKGAYTFNFSANITYYSDSQLNKYSLTGQIVQNDAATLSKPETKESFLSANDSNLILQQVLLVIANISAANVSQVYDQSLISESSGSSISETVDYGAYKKTTIYTISEHKVASIVTALTFSDTAYTEAVVQYYLSLGYTQLASDKLKDGAPVISGALYLNVPKSVSDEVAQCTSTYDVRYVIEHRHIADTE